ncbi:MAG: hypothetical protein K2X77_20635 [Candidatus Obscuribacterales bacterium]|nr:hypothetical protein [Candidatus Obscuribacterales bacterium]
MGSISGGVKRGKSPAILQNVSISSTGKQHLCVLLGLCLGISLAAPADAKRLSFQLPVQDKLSEGSSPNSAEAPSKKPQSLAPVGLHDDEKQAEEESADGVLKSTVRQDQFVSKSAGTGAPAASGKKESVIGRNGDKLTKEKAPDVGPLALIESDEELEKKAETQMDAEKRQLSELWQSTIGRNPDIQFVINKLQPTTDQGHAMATTMKFLSATLFSAMNMAPMMMPGMSAGSNMMPAMGVMSGGNLIQGLFQDKQAKAARKSQVSQEQATILYKIVRDTADKLVASYRDYKKEMTSVERAADDLQDLQSMVAESRASQSAPQQIEMEYTLRKAKREIEEKSEQARLHRQQLSDLAGPEAVAKLETDLENERLALKNLVSPMTPNPPIQTNMVPQNASTGPFVNPLQQPVQAPEQTAGKEKAGKTM